MLISNTARALSLGPSILIWTFLIVRRVNSWMRYTRCTANIPRGCCAISRIKRGLGYKRLMKSESEQRLSTKRCRTISARSLKINGWVSSNRLLVSKANALALRRSRRSPPNTCGLNFPSNMSKKAIVCPAVPKKKKPRSLSDCMNRANAPGRASCRRVDTGKAATHSPATPFHLFRPAFLKIRIFLFFVLMAKRRWLASGVMRSFFLCGWIEALHCINISAGWPALPDLPARRSDTRLVGGRPDRTRRRAGQEIEQPALKVRLAWDHDRRRRWRKLRAIGDHCKRRAGYRCTGGERYPDQPEYAHSELWHVEVPVDFGEFFFLLAFSREDFALGIYPRLRGGFIELAALLGKTQRLTRDDALVVVTGEAMAEPQASGEERSGREQYGGGFSRQYIHDLPVFKESDGLDGFRRALCSMRKTRPSQQDDIYFPGDGGYRDDNQCTPC